MYSQFKYQTYHIFCGWWVYVRVVFGTGGYCPRGICPGGICPRTVGVAYSDHHVSQIHSLLMKVHLGWRLSHYYGTALGNLSCSRGDHGRVLVVTKLPGTDHGDQQVMCLNLVWELSESPVRPMTTHLSSWDQSILL